MNEVQNALANSAPSFEREMAAYQAHVAKQPAAPGNSTVDPRYIKEQEAFAASQKSQPSISNEQPAPTAASSSRESDLAVLDATFKQIDSRTGRAYGLDPRIAGVLEKARTNVFKGQGIDRHALAAELSNYTGIPVPKTQEPPASVEPQGTPEQRLTAEQEAAVNTILPHIDAEGGIRGRHLTPELTAGYVLPGDIMFDAEETLSMCAIAKAAGFTQADVDRYIQAQR